MKKRNIFEKGFTLVELLIVIALIAILSVAVLATINPIEQSNKARDAKFKNDAAEVLSAYERYYTSQASYPWMDITDATVLSVEETILISSDEAEFGVVAVDGEDETSGRLIASSELKSSFLGKESYVEDLTEENRMYAYHNGTTNSNYVCFHPKAAANRVLTAAGTSTFLKCIDAANTTIIDFGDDNCTLDPDADWSSVPSAIVANVICVPEGSIQ